MDEANHMLRDIRERIARACKQAGRAPAEVSLVGAAKTVTVARLRPFVAAGLAEVGENYVQEGVTKIAALGSLASHGAVRWHLIGALQSNKAADAVAAFDLIHSVDRPALATALNKAAWARDKVQEILLQVNVGSEATKAGCAPADLLALARHCATLPNIATRGLMCLPPYHEDVELIRPYFIQLREMRDALWRAPDAIFADCPAPAHLSMGMSHDFEVAIAEGATLVRVGTALFGTR